EFLHIDVWTNDVSQIKIFPISISTGEQQVTQDLVADQWNSFNIPISAFTDQGLSMADIHQFKFEGEPWAAGTVFIDNVYFYRNPAPASGLEGIWQVASEPGALMVGPSAGSGEWWSSDAQVVADRPCFFDDYYVFGLDGSFANMLGADTWVEPWQGVAAEQCAAPVAPHDGSNPATYLYDENAGTITVNGTGAYIGLPKANNAGELPNVPVPDSIVYNVTLM